MEETSGIGQVYIYSCTVGSRTKVGSDESRAGVVCRPQDLIDLQCQRGITSSIGGVLPEIGNRKWEGEEVEVSVHLGEEIWEKEHRL